jgi:hypothetical protein
MYKFDIPNFVSVPIAYSLSVKGLIANAFSNIDACVAVKGNTEEVCERATD